MNQPNDTAPDLAEWVDDGRDFIRRVLVALDKPADLMQTHPGVAVRVVDEVLAEPAADPAPSPEDEWSANFRLIMWFAAEFLITVYGARWEWTVDASSPLGGRWVVTGLPHPLGQETLPVDVPWLANAAAVSGNLSVVNVINQAIQLSMMRVFR
ncbi:hypothetical protein [Kitasatospora sp. SUK 42]|uniref:hypothetical protein n=1 Tax=Kitasatospora sp. SUK 42 TaxID=1588882 RepID=UPI0018CA2DA1|nr:hypothetical protein [Kitasatospora sp. SUK 42]MBV2152757.1 hypothetical protein [Kitasatospora sp. SUK 42]